MKTAGTMKLLVIGLTLGLILGITVSVAAQVGHFLTVRQWAEGRLAASTVTWYIVGAFDAFDYMIDALIRTGYSTPELDQLNRCFDRWTQGGAIPSQVYNTVLRYVDRQFALYGESVAKATLDAVLARCGLGPL